MTTSIITPDHHAAICQAACENRKQVLKELKCLATKLDRCERLVTGCADGQQGKAAKPPLITYPQYPRYPDDIPQIAVKPDTLPPWVEPRSKSVELIGSDLKVGCQCTKRNGLQDDCERMQCRGQPQCLTKPDPACPPSGAWKKYATPCEAKAIIAIGNRRPHECEKPTLPKEALDLLKRHTRCHGMQHSEVRRNENSHSPHEQCHKVTVPIDIVVHIDRQNNTFC